VLVSMKVSINAQTRSVTFQLPAQDLPCTALTIL
jgi:hypothetical protein